MEFVRFFYVRIKSGKIKFCRKKFNFAYNSKLVWN